MNVLRLALAVLFPTDRERLRQIAQRAFIRQEMDRHPLVRAEPEAGHETGAKRAHPFAWRRLRRALERKQRVA